MKHAAWIVAVTTMMVTTPAWAGRLPVHDAAESPQYGTKAGGMLGRGILNAATCFVDPIVAVVNETRNGPPLVGTLVGVGEGLGCGTLRLLSGVVDVGTFWVPGFNGIPVSPEYGECFGDADDGGGMGTAPRTHDAAPAVDRSWSSGTGTLPPMEPAKPAPAPDVKPQYSK